MRSILSILGVTGRGASSPRRRLLLIPVLLAASGLGGPAGLAAPAESGASKEYQVKAAFLFNFSKFVEWPALAFAETNSPIRIGILGASPFGNSLAQVVAEGGNVGGRMLQIKSFSRIEDVKGCHILFISRTEKSALPGILAALAGSSVLTVSETDGFCEQGGMINFYLQGRKVRFEINTGAAKRAAIRMSSQFISLGKAVESEKEEAK